MTLPLNGQYSLGRDKSYVLMVSKYTEFITRLKARWFLPMELSVFQFIDRFEFENSRKVM